ncbi:MAG: nicotinate phosphoribosyltransferase, partial [Nitrospirales bacterium]
MTRQEFVTPENMGLLTDLYELTMAASYFEHCRLDRATFDLFVRKLPPQRSYLVFAGLEHACFYLTHLSFGPEAIRYLRSTGQFSAGFLKYLRGFRFRGNVDAMPEGTIFFPNEPVLRVSGNIIETQIVETYLLNAINLQSLIATKASRVVTAAQGRPVIEFGLRRTHGADAGLKGARAAYLAGCAGSSNVLAGQVYGIPVFGTMAHSFVQAFPSELEAFRAFAQTYPSGTTLLIDTFDTARGAHHAVHVARELAREGHRLGGVRLDSGDLVALSQEVRKILDKEGLTGVKIFASGNLHEARIATMLREGACLDAFGVGTELSVSGDAPHLDVVYKMSEVVRKGTRYPTLKLSAHKQSFPGHKQVYRREEDGRIMEDVLAVQGEQVRGRPLLRPVLRNGRLVRALPSLVSIRRHAERERRTLPPALRELHSTT